MKKIKKYGLSIGIFIFVVLCAIALWLGCSRTNQASNSLCLRIVFEGEYIIEGEESKPIDYNNLPVTNKDVTLIGNFYIVFPDDILPKTCIEKGQVILLYFNHIGAELYINGQNPHVFDSEKKVFGEDSCGETWIVYTYEGEADDKVIIELKNPHSFGNSLAVRDFLDSMYSYSGATVENMLLDEGSVSRTVGMIILVVALVFIGVAIFSFMLRFSQSSLILAMGLLLFFGSGYFILDSPNIYFWSRNVIFNTMGQYFCMILYSFFIFCLILYFIPKKEKRIGKYFVYADLVILICLVLTTLIGKIYVYDTILFFGIITSIFSLLFIGLCGFCLRKAKRGNFIVLALAIIALFIFDFDFIATAFGWWQGGEVSKIIFLVISLTAIILIFKIIPSNLLASEREKKLKIELEKNKTAIMLSQIQPHFLYNTLAAIRYLCKDNPIKAQEALDDFSMYLRGNMDSLQEQNVIPFSRELSHIETYLNLEKMSFGDKLKIEYQIEENNFLLPCLTVQPFVENAVKHGVCSRENGGTIIISTKREGQMIKIEIIDDGVGFNLVDYNSSKENHIGIKNVKKRLESMKCGTLSIESEIGKGTRVTIWIDSSKVGDEA